MDRADAVRIEMLPPRDEWPDEVGTTCVDCGGMIAWLHRTAPRLCHECLATRERLGIPLDRAGATLLRTWVVNVEFTWPALPVDLAYRAYGDKEGDFARRALDRVRHALEGALRDGGFAHYCITAGPRRCA